LTSIHIELSHGIHMSAKGLELLLGLGLTTSEAKVYLALINQGPTSAERIAQITKIARERVYMLMPILRKKGLVEEIIASPKLFEAISMDIGLKILINVEKEKMKAHQEMAQEILENTAAMPQRLDNDFKISLIPQGQMVPLSITKASEDARESINLIVKERNMEYNLQRFPEKVPYRKIVAKGVVVRIITDLEPKSTELLDSLKGTHVRTMQEIGLGLSIIDSRKVFMRLCNDQKWDECQMVYMENTAIANIFGKYFDNMWLNAKPFKVS
jgi:sugar-specific transcriptional regulator TrmB